MDRVHNPKNPRVHFLFIRKKKQKDNESAPFLISRVTIHEMSRKMMEESVFSNESSEYIATLLISKTYLTNPLTIRYSVSLAKIFQST